MGELARQLRDLLLTQRRWDAAAELLRRHADEAADAIVALPFEQQQLLFRNLPLDLAAKLAGHFLYFHAYVLLCSLTTPEIAAIMGAMGSTERDQFLDALPEESWRSLMNTLDEAHLMAAEAKAPVTEPTLCYQWRTCSRSSKRGRSQRDTSSRRERDSSGCSNGLVG